MNSETSGANGTATDHVIGKAKYLLVSSQDTSRLQMLKYLRTKGMAYNYLCHAPKRHGFFYAMPVIIIY